MTIRSLHVFIVSIVVAIVFHLLGGNSLHADERPNIVIILVDDMGFSDIGCYGSEIPTPHIDSLAEHGIRFTQFYNTGRCCPTRASLMTGLYSHSAGVGHMTGDSGKQFPGFRGKLNRNCVTIAEVLKEAGYFTAISGKWHLGATKQEYWPNQRGFDRFYGCPQGGGFYFNPKEGRDIVLNNEIVIQGGNNQQPEDYYVTDAFTDYAIQFVEEGAQSGKPYFLYLPHIAPHFPLEAPEELIQKYLGKYDGGWEAVRTFRHARQLEIGLLSEDWLMSPPDQGDLDWSELEERSIQARAMSVYAAIIDRLDQNVGRLMSAIEEQGDLDNTVVMFLSDNGGCAEGGLYVNHDKSKVIGEVHSNVRYGKAWANASNTPFREYKHYVHEGGIATPLIVQWPNAIPESLNGSFNRSPGHVIDLMATCVDLAEANYPEEYRGESIHSLEGESLKPLFLGQSRVQPPMFWEHEGNRAVRVGDWKLVAKGESGDWELYNMQPDRTELHDLASAHPEKVEELRQLWWNWAQRVNCVPHPNVEFVNR